MANKEVITDLVIFVCQPLIDDISCHHAATVVPCVKNGIISLSEYNGESSGLISGIGYR